MLNNKLPDKNRKKFHGSIRASLSVSAADPLLTHQLDLFDASAGKSTENGAKNLNNFNGRISAVFDPRSTPPMNLLGGGSYRFVGASTPERRQRVSAAIDSEVGVGADIPIISADGVVAYRIPKRR